MRLSKIAESPPYAVEKALKALGRNIRTARLRRKLSREKLAEKIGLSRYVMADVENGKPTTSIAAYIGALYDREGKALEEARSPTTAPKRSSRTMDDDF